MDIYLKGGPNDDKVISIPYFMEVVRMSQPIDENCAVFEGEETPNYEPIPFIEYRRHHMDGDVMVYVYQEWVS